MIKLKLKPIERRHQQYQQILQNKKEINPIPFNLQLLSNPFLKDQDKYKMILKEIQLYNKRVNLKQITDQYEIRSYQKIFVILGDLIQLTSVVDMKNRLEQTIKWWKEQKRMIKQRKETGGIKYKVDRMIDKVRQFKQKQRLHKSLIVDSQPFLTHQKRFQAIYPFQMKYRTNHHEMDVPAKRLSQYKRKVIYNIDDQNAQEEVIPYTDKVAYPKPEPYFPTQQVLDANVQNSAQNGGQNTLQNTVNPENPSNIENKPKQNTALNSPESQVPPQNQPPADPNDPNSNAQNQQPAQDLGGFGQEPEQPGQQQQPEQSDVLDKLAPRHKIYKASIKTIEQQEKVKRYKAPYLFHLGTDDHIQRRLQIKLLKKNQQSLQLKRQQQQFIDRANEWANEKSKLLRESQHNLQNMVIRYKHAYSHQIPLPKEMLKPIDQKKYGFYLPAKPQQKPAINLHPQQPQYKTLNLQQQTRKDKLNTLKGKFSKILNLNQTLQMREKVEASMCQVSSRRKDFSVILQEHSLQKQRDLQLQQIQKIKHNLGKQRINLNIRSLAQALVANCPQSSLQKFQSPSKMLPNNPFFEQAKKKKKKK